MNHIPHYVYRCYDDGGRLLYVGITYNPPKRMEQHAAKSAWWPEVATVRNTVYPDMETALARERRAIFEESPLHNIKGVGARTLRMSPRGARRAPLNHSAEAVRWIVRESDLTQRAIAKAVGISPGLLSEICNGTRNASDRVLSKLADILDCPVIVLKASRRVAA